MRILSIAVAVLCTAAGLFAATPHYLVTNDDNGDNTATFFVIEPDGSLTQVATVLTGGSGISGGFFGMTRISTLHSQKGDCLYISNAGFGDIAGIDFATQAVTGSFFGSAKDAGTSNGIGLAMNHAYLYASYSDSNTIGTFKVGTGCTLKFLGDISVMGLRKGVINGMAVHEQMLLATYGDGSIESFDISAGIPVSNGDQQISSGSQLGNSYPNGIDITKDGHFAIFGDTATSTIIEVSDISSGKLAPTVVYHFGRKGISSSTVRLSPDETMLYIVNTQAARLTAAFFDKTTGTLTKGCISGLLRGYVKHFSYLGGLALQKNTGTGGSVYIGEFGGDSGIAVVDVQSGSGTCTLQESSNSPVADPNSVGLLSVGTFPPRSF